VQLEGRGRQQSRELSRAGRPPRLSPAAGQRPDRRGERQASPTARA
jgi:hypothetical protein